ncbi:D-glycerate dehydrogenase [Paracoccus sp. S-4012]|uniref:2-hydroxyacid dehydrogenase n=1 Tax=Paracoccus sp. S-4012 TaxID=2665648 RepID=UPI0012B0C239|nr:D-glycerate dehydrogenase [Paracoccus sp. S-4012]MRX49769.1 D-glycerate dehydrogenase [Paracoccus sp. S-4012]
MKLFVTRRMTPRAEATIRHRFDATFRDSTTPLTAVEAAAALRDYDAVIPTLGDGFGAAAFAGEGLRARLLANFGAGTNHIDLAAARAAGIAVTNTPDVVTDATADIALMLMLMTCRRASEGERRLRAGEWTGWHPTQLLGRHLGGMTVGIVGMGRIGKAIARRCHGGFGMDVVFFNRSHVSALDLPARQMPDLREMLAACDIAVIAVPGGTGTRHLIGPAELAALGPQGFLVNIARGDVVDESALIQALHEGQIAGAGLDVYEHEPHVPQGLLDAPNATLLPHLGTAAEEVRTDMALRALDNVTAFAAGRRPDDLVN